MHCFRPSLLLAVLLAAFMLFLVGCPEEEEGNGFGANGNDQCVGESVPDLCEDHGLECGTHDLVDSCGDDRTDINCGNEDEVCDELETCGGGGEEGVCGCTPEPDEELCEEAEIECGPAADVLDEPIVDSCGDEREELHCGDEEDVCGEYETCGGSEEPGQCGCIPETDEELCDDLDVECGLIEDVLDESPTDACGNVRENVNCGDEEDVCGDYETCGGGGDEGVCGCTPETDDELCDDAGYECGPLDDVVDSCGQERYVDSCGTESEVCDDYDTCGGGDDPGVCGCTPTTCEDEGILCGEIDDECGGVVDCDLFCADQVSVGDQHACAVGSESVKCWGRNSSGQLGVGDTDNRENPASVITDPSDDESVLMGVDEVATGTEHSCALMLDETVRCWGWNDYGQLGDGSTTDSTTPSTSVASGTIALDAGANHTCAIVIEEESYSDGTTTQTQDVERVRCWGHNSHGQLGNPSLNLGSTVAQPQLVQHSTDELDDYIAVDIAVGDYHTCGLYRGPFTQKPFDESAEDDLEDSVWCWGDNRFGQIDPGSLEDKYVDDFPGGSYAYGVNLDDDDGLPVVQNPRQIDDPIHDSPGDLVVTAGADHTCLHDEEDEETFCRGAFVEDADDDDDVECEIELDLFDGIDDDDGPQYTEVEDYAQYCSILPDIDFYTGTFPLFGYTGDDDDGHSLDTIYLDQALDTDFMFEISDSNDVADTDVPDFESLEITSGSNHICARVDHPGLSSSNVYCMGDNRFGQLGDGTDNSWPTFQEVSSDPDGNFVEAIQLSAGDDLTCALLDNNNIKCWGNNEHGQIGNSDLQEDKSLQPFDVHLPIAD